jgi:CRISPR-associated endonuclease/helicase Cas3
VALGLRTLTLQTGQALQSRLGLDDDTLAVVTGAAAVKELYQGNDAEDTSSASDETFFASHHYVHYEGRPVAASRSSGWRKNRRSIAWSVPRCW